MRINKSELLILLILLTLILIGKSNAMPYSQVNMTDNITQTSLAYSYSTVNYSITLYNLTSSKFNLSLPIGIKNLSITNLRLLGISYVILPASSCHTISVSSSCRIVQLDNVSSNETIKLVYSYYQNYTNYNGSFNSTIYFMPSSFTRYLNINMILPDYAYIPDNAYSEPAIYSIVQLNGRFDVIWRFINQSYPNINAYLSLPFTVNYNLNIVYKKPVSYNYSYIYIFIILAIILVSAYYIYKKLKPKRIKSKKKKTSKRLIYGLLSTDEIKVLKSIKKNEFVHQSDIIKNTNFSKVKVSKTISKLLRYKLIKIKQDGRENKVKRI